MPVIQVAPGTGGTGGGDATAANQTTQIGIATNTQTIVTNTETIVTSIEADTTLISDGQLDLLAESVFLDQNDLSVFKSSTKKSILSLNSEGLPNTKVREFSDLSLIGLASAITSYIQSNPMFIISLCYSNNGVDFTALLLFNDL